MENAAAVRLKWLRNGDAAACASATVSFGQEYLFRGFFDSNDDEEGEGSEDGADPVHHLNKYWVPMDVVLETIGIADLKEKLVARYVAMLAHLAATTL